MLYIMQPALLWLLISQIENITQTDRISSTLNRAVTALLIALLTQFGLKTQQDQPRRSPVKRPARSVCQAE